MPKDLTQAMPTGSFGGVERGGVPPSRPDECDGQRRDSAVSPARGSSSQARRNSRAALVAVGPFQQSQPIKTPADAAHAARSQGMAKDKSAGAEPVSDDVRAKMCADIDSFQREADRAFSGARDMYIVWALCIVARELRLMRLGVRS